MTNTFTKNNTLAAKAVGIIFMLAHHLFSASQLELWKLEISDRWLNFSAIGKLCVGIFIFLSGYGLTLKYKKIPLPCIKGNCTTDKFVIQSYFSLMSQFLFVFIFCWLIGLLPSLKLYEVYGKEWKNAILYFITNALGLSALFRFPTLNPTWWYISMAIIVILLLPVLIKLYRKVGVSVVMLCGLLPYVVTVESGIEFFDWLFCLALAIMAAEEDFFARITRLFEKNGRKYMAKFLRIVFLCITISIFFYIRKFNLKVICNGVLVFCIIWLTWELLPNGSVIQKPFCFLGSHATNIFLIHTLIYLKFGNYIYSSGKPILIVLTLLAVSLIVSVIIEILKKLSQYDRLVGKIKNKLAACQEIRKL